MNLATWIQIFGLKKRQSGVRLMAHSHWGRLETGLVERLKGNYSTEWNVPTCSREGSGHIISSCPRSVKLVWCIHNGWNQDRGHQKQNGPIILCRIFQTTPKGGSGTIGLCTHVYSPSPRSYLDFERCCYTIQPCLYIKLLLQSLTKWYRIFNGMKKCLYPDVDVYFRTYFSLIDTFEINH